jgi:LmbE family N-acetylglucosaminyl deacetylase
MTPVGKLRLKRVELSALAGDQIRTVLCLGAHADDIEIGAGGTIIKLLNAVRSVDVHWIVLSGNERREEEARASADAFLKDAGTAEVSFGRFRESYFPYTGAEIKQFFDRLGADVRPDLILTHARDDKHQDHRLVCELTWNTWRDNLILEYEIPKYDGDLGTPNTFVALEEQVCDRKIETLLEAFGSQADKHWFSADTFRALMRIRGIESRSPTGYAEAFYVHKLLLE